MQYAWTMYHLRSDKLDSIEIWNLNPGEFNYKPETVLIRIRVKNISL